MRCLFKAHETLAAFGVLEAGTGPRAKRIVALGLGVGALTGVVMVAGIVLAALPQAAADKAYWTVSGPPCPVATFDQIRRIGRALAQTSDVGEGHFARISGAVTCNNLTDGFLGIVRGTTCQFAGPRALGVWSEGGSSFYDVPDGPATVTVSRNRPPRCVLASNYRG